MVYGLTKHGATLTLWCRDVNRQVQAGCQVRVAIAGTGFSHRRWSCAWFCEASAWLRLVRALWEPPDPFEVAAIARQLKPVCRRVRAPEEAVFKGREEAKVKAILARAQAGWAAWRQSVTLGGFWHTP